MFLYQFFTLSPILTKLRPNSAKDGSKSTKNDFRQKSDTFGEVFPPTLRGLGGPPASPVRSGKARKGLPEGLGRSGKVRKEGFEGPERSGKNSKILPKFNMSETRPGAILR